VVQLGDDDLVARPPIPAQGAGGVEQQGGGVGAQGDLADPGVEQAMASLASAMCASVSTLEANSPCRLAPPRRM